MLDKQSSSEENAQLLAYLNTRKQSIVICDGLSDEDLQAQSMPDASPLKWHLAHTTWAFETFILKPYVKNYNVFDSHYEFLFNSYYNAVGEQFSRAQRGLLTRPSISDILKYRQHVDVAMLEFLRERSVQVDKNLHYLIMLTINHEQQHQELMLTDIKHLLSINPLSPAYCKSTEVSPSSKVCGKLVECETQENIAFKEGLYPIGHQSELFCFDNETPQHNYYLSAFSIDTGLVSNQHYLEFIEDGGYRKSEYWLSEAWYQIKQQNIQHPHYWCKRKDNWYQFSLLGLQQLRLQQPVQHISYFEASAFAAWADKRLPTEYEWETAARSQNPRLKQMFNQLWQWTSSSYAAYPGFSPAQGVISEYNGKFMVNQYVLRGGSIATPAGHIRPSYRNFFYPNAYWQFSGIRLAESI